MTPVVTMDEKLRRLAKPDLRLFADTDICDGDVLVLCGGFEDRVVGVIDSVLMQQVRPKVLLIDYLPAYAENRADFIWNLCVKRGLVVTRITYDRCQPTGFGDEVASQIPNDGANVFVDISGMSRLLIVQVLVAMRLSPRSFRGVHIVYAYAKCYPPTEDEVTTAISQSTQDPSLACLFLSSGVLEVCVVPELSATSLGANQSRLVFFPTFNTDQLVALKSELQPSRFAYIHGVPPDGINRWRTGAIAKLNWLLSIEGDNHFKTSTLNYTETLNCLCDIYRSHNVKDRILVSPTGSKMQSVAVGLFRAFVEDVQIVYPTPRQFPFPNSYTSGVEALYCLSIAAYDQLVAEPSKRGLE